MFIEKVPMNFRKFSPFFIARNSIALLEMLRELRLYVCTAATKQSPEFMYKIIFNCIIY